MRTYRVAIVGLGRMGSTIDDEHPGLSPYSIAAATRASDRLELVAGSDLIAERRDAFGARWGIDSLYQDYVEMIERERPDLVAVCTRATSLPKPHDRAPSSDFREDAHAEIGARVAEAGVPMVYLEKAISNTIRGADSLLEACRRNGTVFNSGVLRRFCSWADVTRAAIEEGRIGEPQVVAHFGGGSLMHSHVHSIDTISYLLGDPGVAAVRGEILPRETRIVGNRIDEDPRAAFHIVFANGVEAYSVPGGTAETEVIGTEGSIRTLNTLDGGEASVRIRSSRGRSVSEWEPVPVPPVAGDSPVVACLGDLVDSYESGRPTKANVESSHGVAEALLAVPESHRQGGVLGYASGREPGPVCLPRLGVRGGRTRGSAPTAQTRW